MADVPVEDPSLDDGSAGGVPEGSVDGGTADGGTMDGGTMDGGAVDPGMAVPYDAGEEASFSEDGTASGTEEYSEDGTVDEGIPAWRTRWTVPPWRPCAMMLELKTICKTYTQGKLDVPVLKDISLSVEEGEYVAIMGPRALARPH